MLGLLLFAALPSTLIGLKTPEEQERDARNRLDSVDAFFVKTVHSAEDLKATKQEELEERLEKSIQFFEKMIADRSALKSITDIELAQILNQVDGWLARCIQFREAMLDREKPFSRTLEEYNAFVDSAWSNGGLDKLVQFVQNTTSTAVSFAPLLSLLILPLALIFG